MKTLSWYEKQLDLNSLSPEIRAEYEREADRLATAITISQQKRKEIERLIAEEMKAKGQQIAKLFHSAPDTLFAEYGHEFIEDYEVNGCIVISKVCRDDQEGVWTMNSQIDAQKKVKQLVNWRIYNHYVRD